MARPTSLLGNRGRALYPPRNFQPAGNNALTQRRGSPEHLHHGGSGGGSQKLLSRQSLMILTVGILFGYLLLPVLLVNHLGITATGGQIGFDNRPQLQSLQPSSIHLEGVDAIGRLTPANKVAEPSRSLQADEDIKNAENQPPNEPPQEDEDGDGIGAAPGDPSIVSDADSPSNAGVQSVAANRAKISKTAQMMSMKGKSKKSSPKGSKITPTSAGTTRGTQAATFRSQTTSNAHKSAVPHGTSPSELPDVVRGILEQQSIFATQSVPTTTTPFVIKTNTLPDHHRMKIIVTGGAGFVGSHLVDKLMGEGHEVIVVDNFFTGQKKNIAHWLRHPNFSLVVHDVTEPLTMEADQIYHLACPASPPHYQYNPVKTIKTSTMGTLNMLGLAKRVRARILLTSTSEIYGDPEQHPQSESYWGNVNTIGPRSCYDEGKRVAETMMYSYRKQNNVDVRVARIFNTFGPRMHPNDGRVVSNFIIQSLQNKNLTVYGNGNQTRSFQYVSDLVEGLHALMNGEYEFPVNLGNPDEYAVKNFAEYIKNMTKSNSTIVYLPKSQDDPSQRRPDIATAKREINWEPVVSVEEGLKETIQYFSRVLDEAGEIIPTGPGAAKPEA